MKEKGLLMNWESQQVDFGYIARQVMLRAKQKEIEAQVKNTTNKKGE